MRRLHVFRWLTAAALAAALTGGHTTVWGQVGQSCGPDARLLTGAWTTTETIDGENTSLWRGTLHLVQRGPEVAGRWEPPGGAPERAVLGSFRDGILRVTQRGMPAMPAAEVAGAPPRSWLLSLSSDGKLLSGRWSEQEAGMPARQGDLFASGEAGCTFPAGLSTQAPAGAPALEDTLAVPGCQRWDLSGTWIVAGTDSRAGTAGAAVPQGAGPAGDGDWQFRLWQDGETVLGWYEPRTAVGDGTAHEPRRPAWVVDGQIRGRVIRLVLHLGDSATLARFLTLSTQGDTLESPWPLPFGPAESETLHGNAHCRELP